ncbi:MAG: serine/threonine-protein kinase [Planctomycetota bacterium]
MSSIDQSDWQTQIRLEQIAKEFEEELHVSASPGLLETMLQKHADLPAKDLFRVLVETELDARQADPFQTQALLQQLKSDHPQFRSVLESLEPQPEEEPSGGQLPQEVLRAGDHFEERFQIVAMIGHGATCLVFKALDQETSDLVAIKLMRPDLLQALSQSSEHFFAAEERVLKTLNDERVVRYFGSGVHQGLPYLVTEYIDGVPLDQYFQQNVLNERAIAGLVADIATTVQAAHQANVVHRDLKPSNIIVDRYGKPRLTDFGASIHYDNIGRGVKYAGTPLYMSPEQARGGADLVDGRTDIYSLGVILYELLTGQHPFGNRFNTPLELAIRIESADVPPPSQRTKVHPTLEAICLRALAREPENRFQNAASLARCLRRFERRWKTPIIIGCVAAILCGIIAVSSRSTPIRTSVRTIHSIVRPDEELVDPEAGRLANETWASATIATVIDESFQADTSAFEFSYSNAESAGVVEAANGDRFFRTMFSADETTAVLEHAYDSTDAIDLSFRVRFPGGVHVAGNDKGYSGVILAQLATHEVEGSQTLLRVELGVFQTEDARYQIMFYSPLFDVADWIDIDPEEWTHLRYRTSDTGDGTMATEVWVNQERVVSRINGKGTVRDGLAAGRVSIGGSNSFGKKTPLPFARDLDDVSLRIIPRDASSGPAHTENVNAKP